MKKFLIPFGIIMFLVGFNSSVSAGWWIFGQGTDEIVTNYIYINKSSFDESGQEITLYKESLKNGVIRINGKASVRNAKVGAVFISLDNKASWQKASLSSNGYFEFTFTPEINKVYDVYIEINDSLGKTNDVDSTYRKLKVVDENISEKVAASLKALMQAYQDEDPAAFMKYVSDNYAGDYSVLDFSIRKDFNAFDFVEIRTFINNISSDNAGRVYAAIQYSRKVGSSKTGRVFSDRGYTEFVFENVSGVFKVFSMKNPLLFGLSDAGEVSTGTIQNTGNDPIILVDESGNVDEKPFRTAIDVIENDAEIDDNNGSGGPAATPGPVTSGTATVLMSPGSVSIEGYFFFYDNNSDPEFLLAPGGANVKRLAGDPDIDTVATATVSGADTDSIVISGAGSFGSYAVRFSDGNYMLLEHTSGAEVGANLKYRFQPDGSPNF